MNRANNERHSLIIVVYVVLAALVIMMALGVWLWMSRRKLKKLNEELYHQARARISPTLLVNDAPEETIDSDISDMADASDVSEISDNDGYKELVFNLQEIMETSPDIFLPDFSLDTLARISNTSSRKVSQVINSHF